MKAVNANPPKTSSDVMDIIIDKIYHISRYEHSKTHEKYS